jgi:parallel beta-helix repeat protein
VVVKTILATAIIAVLLLCLCAEVKAVEIQPLIITINPDGSIDPVTDVLYKVEDTYVVTSNVNCSIYVKKGDIIVDGANHSIQGPDASQDNIAITLMASNVTVTNFRISGWATGIYGAYNNNTITNNVFKNNNQGITIYACDYVVSQNSISDSNIAIKVVSGALQIDGDNILITLNHIFSNFWAFDVVNSNGTSITKNKVTDNTAVLTLGTQNADITETGLHKLYLNNFINNTKLLNIPFGGPFASSAPTISPAGIWDNGTVGNYYHDYLSKYPNASQITNSKIGNTEYLIEHIITWESDYANGTRKQGNTTLGIAIDHYPLITAQNYSYGANPQPYIANPTQSPTATLLPTPTLSATPTIAVNPTTQSNTTPTPTTTIPEIPTGIILTALITIIFTIIIITKKSLLTNNN